MFAMGIDLGTSGVRTAVLNVAGNLVSQASVEMPTPDLINSRPMQDPNIWWLAVEACLNAQRLAMVDLGLAFDSIAGIAVDGTSGTVLLADSDLNPCSMACMYNSTGFDAEAARIDRVASQESHGRGSGSGLARALFLLSQPNSGNARYVLHQADWIAARLAGKGGFSDQNNVLKTGFDLKLGIWPDWISELGFNPQMLPEVLEPGEIVSEIDSEIASRFGLSVNCHVHAGTTDSIAAFLATGAREPGDAVTSLGTTLVIKMVSNKDVRDLASGVYSHRLGENWLPGGASNSGGGALLRHFSIREMELLGPRIQPDRMLNLGYYPLPGVGERFPVCDPNMRSIHEPRPTCDVEFFQGLLEGVAAIEKQAFDCLSALGAPFPVRIFTVGGGANNDAWRMIRERVIGVPVIACRNTEAAAGAARLVLAGMKY